MQLSKAGLELSFQGYDHKIALLVRQALLEIKRIAGGWSRPFLLTGRLYFSCVDRRAEREGQGRGGGRLRVPLRAREGAGPAQLQEPPLLAALLPLPVRIPALLGGAAVRPCPNLESLLLSLLPL